METKKIKITNKKQFECLVATMEKYPQVAKGLRYAEGANFGKKKFDDTWEALKIELNSLGPPIRSLAGWQKVWNDYKLKIKHKLAHNLTEARATGGGPNQTASFSSCEEAVVALLELNKAVATEGNVFGLGSTVTPSPQSQRQVVCDIQEPSGSGTSRTQSGSMGSMHQQEPPDSSDEEYVEEYVDPQDEAVLSNPSPDIEQHFTKIDQREELLKTQTEYLKDIRDGVTDLALYSRKRYYLEKERLRVKQENALRMEKQHAERIEFEKAFLKYKMKKLELLKETKSSDE